jgi:hypothetical protein
VRTLLAVLALAAIAAAVAIAVSRSQGSPDCGSTDKQVIHHTRDKCPQPHDPDTEDQPWIVRP